MGGGTKFPYIYYDLETFREDISGVSTQTPNTKRVYTGLRPNYLCFTNFEYRVSTTSSSFAPSLFRYVLYETLLSQTLRDLSVLSNTSER